MGVLVGDFLPVVFGCVLFLLRDHLVTCQVEGQSEFGCFSVYILLFRLRLRLSRWFRGVRRKSRGSLWLRCVVGWLGLSHPFEMERHDWLFFRGNLVLRHSLQTNCRVFHGRKDSVCLFLVPIFLPCLRLFLRVLLPFVVTILLSLGDIVVRRFAF